MEKEENKEPVFRYDLYPRTGAPIDFVDCVHCGFRNIINCPHPGPKKRLASAKCMNCGERLTCPDCESKLREGLITELDGILFCLNDKCGLWFDIW